MRGTLISYKNGGHWWDWPWTAHIEMGWEGYETFYTGIGFTRKTAERDAISQFRKSTLSRPERDKVSRFVSREVEL